MGSVSSCCRTCSCPRENATAPGRRLIFNQSQRCKELQLHGVSSKVNITSEYIEKPDGALLFSKLYEPKDPTKAKGMICHCIGFGDYSEWLPHEICIEYAQYGYVVFSVDWKGHGHSDGIFVDIVDFDTDIVDEGIWAFNYAINKYIKPHKIYAETIDKNNNYFLNGSSMGGAIAIKIALKSAQLSMKWKGITLICPMVGLKEEVKPPKWVIWCLRHFCLPCCPKAKLIPNASNALQLTRDVEIQKHFNTNPILIGHSLSLTTAYNLLTATETIAVEMHKLKIPVFICHGDDDQVTDCEMSKQFYHKCACNDEDKTIKIYKGKGHLLYQEKAGYVEDIVKWMDTIMTKYYMEI